MSCVEAGMGMEGQIMCVEKRTFRCHLGPQNSPKSLTAGDSPRPHWESLVGFKEPTSKGKGGGGRQNDLYPRAPETLASPLFQLSKYVLRNFGNRM